MSSDRASRFVTRLLRVGFRVGGKLPPSVAMSLAVWLFTKPRRSEIRAHESLWLASANSYFMEHKNHKLAVMEWGSGPTILCVHGWSSRGLRFSSLIDPLIKSGYRVVAFDAPAHGRSSGSHMDLMDYADSILAVTDKIGPVYGIIAHSLGAAATLLVLERGLKIEKAVFFSALNGIRGPLDYLASTLQISDEVLEKIKLVFEKKFGRSIESLEAVRIVPHLKTPPLLIVHDKNDHLLPYHNALDLTGVWKNSQLITTIGKGHMPILDDGQVIEEALSFIKASGG